MKLFLLGWGSLSLFLAVAYAKEPPFLPVMFLVMGAVLYVLALKADSVRPRKPWRLKIDDKPAVPWTGRDPMIPNDSDSVPWNNDD